MASNNGRGPTRRAGFKYTDTIADADSTQAILNVQDISISELNRVAAFLNSQAIAEYIDFAASPSNEGKERVIFDRARRYGINGFITQDPQIAESVASADIAPAVTTFNIDDGTGFPASGLLYIESSAALGQVIAYTIVGNAVTITSTGGVLRGFSTGDAVIAIRAVGGGAEDVGGISAVIAVVDLKN